jgi:hypothetical protein
MLALGALTMLVGVHLVFFAIRAWHVLTFPYPLDYGEGPLLAQVSHLRSGVIAAAPVRRPRPTALSGRQLSAGLSDRHLAGRSIARLDSTGECNEPAGRTPGDTLRNVDLCPVDLAAHPTTPTCRYAALQRDNQVRRLSLPSRFWRCRLCVNGAH